MNKEPLKIAFIDIDGVLTPVSTWTPGISPEITQKSITALKKLKSNNYTLVFITARGAVELRIKKGFEYILKKNKLLEGALIFAANGLDQVTYAHDLKMINNKVVYKNGNAVIITCPAIKKETFGDLDKFLLYKMLLGRDIKQELKYSGFKIKPARIGEMVSDARISFELETRDDKILEAAKKDAIRIVKRQREIFLRTNKFGSPVDLDVYAENYNILIAPAGLGKHFGVLRALKILEVMPKDKIIAYAFGDRDSDSKMKIRKDIIFLKVKNNTDFSKKVDEIIKKH
ncbi:MAG: hypothetical protein WCI04_05505 [archaeon]